MKLRYILLCLLLCCTTGFLTAQTQVSGMITTNTTWNQAGSPYIVTGNVIVAMGATLSIRPGVEVRFMPGKLLGVRGKLQAIGLDTAKVRFTSHDNSPQAGDWRGIIVSGKVRMRHVVGRYAEAFLYLYDGGMHLTELSATIMSRNDTAVVFDGGASDSLRIHRCLFEHNRVGVFADSNTVITRSIFRHNDWGIQADRIIVNRCDFHENGWGAIMERSRIGHSNFVENTEAGLVEFNCGVGKNRFLGNKVGLATRMLPHSRILRNSFRHNYIGVRVGPGTNLSPQAQFRHNGICESWLYNAVMASPAPAVADLRFNCWCETDSAMVAATIFDGNDSTGLGTINFTPFDTVSCFPDNVYPGDANYNQVANVFDLLPIAHKSGQTGPMRPHASLMWVGQPAPNWNDSLPNGVDIKHTDCNGDGVINVLDVAAILVNYGKTHNSLRTASDDTGVPLSLEITQTGSSAGDTLHLAVHLGRSDYQIKDFYGLAFTMSYDTAIVKGEDMSVSFANSWLGTADMDMLTIAKNHPESGQLDLALARFDLVSKDGFGLLANITVVLDEDLTKANDPLTFAFIDVEAIAPTGEVIDIATDNGEVGGTTSLIDPLLAEVKAYPNPANASLLIAHPVGALEEIRLSDATGRVLQLQRNPEGIQSKWDLSAHPEGLYFLTYQSKNSQISQKIIIRR